MKAQSIKSALRKYFKIHQLTVTFEPGVAYTNGRNVNIPLPEGVAFFDKDQVAVAYAYADHEMCHVRHTDFQKYTEYMALEATQSRPGLWKWCMNLLEDIRAENKDIDLFPFKRKALDMLCTHVLSLGDDLRKTSKMSEILKDTYDFVWDYGRGYKAKGRRQPPAEVKSLIQAAGLKDIRSQDKVSDLALKLFKVLVSLDQDAEIKPHEEPSEPVAFIMGWLADHSLVGAMIVSSIMEDCQTYAVKGASSSGVKAISMVEDTTSITGENEQWKDPHPDAQTLKSRDPTRIHDWRNKETYEEILAELGSEGIGAALRMLQLYFRSRGKKSWARDLREGKLDSSRLWKGSIQTEYPTVYKMKKEVAVPGLVMKVMMDLSGSMSTSIVRRVLVCLNEASVSLPKLRMSITGFTTKGAVNFSDWSEEQLHGRCEHLYLQSIREFNERPQSNSVKEAIASVTCTGATPIADSLEEGLEDVLSQEEKNKVILLVTDGEPSYRGVVGDYSKMKQLLHVAHRFGIKIVILEISKKETPLKKYCNAHVRISDVSDLPKAVLEVMKFVVPQEMEV